MFFMQCCKLCELSTKNSNRMKNRLKPVRCDNCKYYDENVNTRGEGICDKDGEYTRNHRVCNKLPTDDDRRNAKLRRNG